MADLSGKKIAVLATDGVEQVELTEPRKALEAAGATCELISDIKTGLVKGWNHKEWGDTFIVEKLLGDANVDDYDGLLLRGGVMNPDELPMIEEFKEGRHLQQTYSSL